MATDNAVSSIAWICATYPTQLDLAAILPAWVQLLPIRADEEEAIVVYNNLCNFIEKVGPQILGANYEHLPKVVALFGHIIGTDFVDEELTQRISTILKSIVHLPAEVTQKVWQSLPGDVQGKLQTLLNGQ